MRLLRISLRGVRPHYRDEVTLDLEKTRGPIVVVTGKNGAGKSMLLGALMAAISPRRLFPSGASLTDVALGRDTFVRAEVETARGRFTITQHADAVSGKGESGVLNAAGAAVLMTGKVTEFDRWAERNLPPQRLLLASTFGAQGRSGLLEPDLTPQDRRLVLFRALGLDRWEPLPQRFRDGAAAARARGEVIDGKLAAERPRAGEAAAAAALGAAKTEAAMRADDLREAQAVLVRVRAQHAALLAAWRDAEAARGRAAAALAAVEDAKRALYAVTDRQEAAAAVLRGAEPVERAVEALPGVQLAVTAAAASAAEAEANLAAAEADLRRAQAEHVTAERAHRAAADATARANRAAADLPGVRASAAQVERLRVELAAAESALAAAQARDAAERDCRAARANRERAERAAADLPAARAAAETARELAVDVAALDASLETLRAKESDLRDATLDVAGKRIDHLRGVLVDISERDSEDKAGDLRHRASEGLIDDDERAAAAVEAPGKLAECRNAIAVDATEVSRRRYALGQAEALAARLPDLERAAREFAIALESEVAAAEKLAAVQTVANAADAEGLVTAARRALSVAEAHAARLPDLERAARESEIALAAEVAAARVLTDAEAAVRRARHDVEPRRQALEQARADRDRLAAEAKRLAAVAARAPEVAAARARAEELAGQRAAADEALRAARQVVAETPEPPTAEPVPDVTAQEKGVTDAEAALRAADGAVAVAARALADAQAAALRVAELEAERRAIDAEVADHVVLERTLKDALQLSIDAAGPELAALTNDLLRQGFGDRYTVTVETQRVGEKGPVEDCFVQVVDTQNDYAGPATGLSGGQLVIVGTALRCALARIGTRTAGIERPTLVLDESGAALEKPLVPAWVAMLRMAAVLTGADKILVVSHDPDVWALADSVVRIREGRIEIAA